MKSPNYYKVRRLVRYAFVLAVLLAFYLIATRIWWNENGLCIGTIERCGL
jgi:hypothetical protein